MINLQKAGLVYDLIAKICRQNVPVYDLPAIDTRGPACPGLAVLYRYPRTEGARGVV